MPPKKEQLSSEKLRELMLEKGIRFKGFEPPRAWPERYVPIFRKIRMIEDMRYDSYKSDTKIPSERREYCIQEVRLIRSRAEKLLDNTANESTWRELEHRILKRFDERVICERCENELWIPNHEAERCNTHDQIRLDAERAARILCRCKYQKGSAKRSNNKDENRDLFEHVRETLVRNHPDDDLDRFSLSMTPDLVMGLRVSSNVPHIDDYFPVRQTRILLPFLVLEAKKDSGSPSFRSIQHQTAFPIRRFLLAQEEMYSNAPVGSSEPCLVWFFSNRGELWRLTACTREAATVKMYDLWQGTIQSQDGSLQLLLIIDYIWSWARDVYRPKIRDIHKSMYNSRSLSPTSTDRYRQSSTISIARSATPSPPQYDQERMDGIVVTSENTWSQVHNFTLGVRQEDTIFWRAVRADTTPNNLLQWGVGHEHAPPWTTVGSIRHSDVVDFEFRYFVTKIDHLDDISPLRLDLYNQAFYTNQQGLRRIKNLWLANANETTGADPGAYMPVTFIFQTYFDPATWQIRRVLTCIEWKDDIENPDDLWPQTRAAVVHYQPQIEGHILSIHRVHRRTSVWYALKSVTRVLFCMEDPKNLSWGLLDRLEEIKTMFMELSRQLNIQGHNLELKHHGSALLRVSGTTDHSFETPDLGVEQDTETGPTMLIVRPSSWPVTSPKFCLFVLDELMVDSQDDLSQLLEGAKQARNFYGEAKSRFTPDDWKALHRWCKALSTGA